MTSARWCSVPGGSAGWIGVHNRLASVEISAYSPSQSIFMSVRTVSWFSVTGGIRNHVGVRVTRLNTSRFQPSVLFEAAAILFLFLQSYIVYRENASAGSLRAFLKRPWIGIELLTLAMFVVVFVVDVVLLLKVRAVCNVECERALREQ